MYMKMRERTQEKSSAKHVLPQHPVRQGYVKPALEHCSVFIENYHFACTGCVCGSRQQVVLLHQLYIICFPIELLLVVCTADPPNLLHLLPNRIAVDSCTAVLQPAIIVCQPYSGKLLDVCKTLVRNIMINFVLFAFH